MRSFHLVCWVALLALVGSVVSCRTTPWTRQEAAEWYGRYGSMVRWVGYQGSDSQFHYYIARVTDDWSFIRIRRVELAVADERPYSTASSAPLYYYLVDPSRSFQKIGEPEGGANEKQPFRSETNRTSAAVLPVAQCER